jgi:superfamily II DNA/RNA helicase
VFTATKRDADMIADRLNIAGFAAAALHGDMHQGARNRTLDSLRRGQVKVLVATDVAARGIDVPNITHVVNYDLPKFPEDYVHRIGRTGRAGRNGIAVSLVNHAETMNVRRIERFTKQTIPVDVVEGFEPKRSPAPRSGARPGWKPGDGRGGKPGQRSFHKPAGEGYRGGESGGQREGGYRGDAPRREGFRTDAPRREGGYEGQRREGGYRSEGAPRQGGFADGQRREAPRRERSGGFGAHPRSADSARRTFGDR